MQTRFKFPAIFLTLFLGVMVIFSGCSKKSADTQTSGSGERPTISAAERALAMLEVQNTFSKHHGYMLIDQCEELDKVWVKRDGPYGKTATMTQPRRIMTGMDTFYKDYCEETKAGKLKTLQEINKLYQEIEVVPENIGVGSWSGGNQPTNPIIEVAGDGKTAKGMWNSNGPGLNTSVKDGKLVVSGMWFWRTYYVDFVTEDGKWKIWHIQMTYDITMRLGGDNDYLLDFSKYKAPEPGTTTFEPGSGYSSNPNPYQDWSPLRLPQTKQRPPMPEPYYTFSETFSY